jgi:NAD(P)-dependent dehydrogenase (short-subunit alcohol dehydrogenase family)
LKVSFFVFSYPAFPFGFPLPSLILPLFTMSETILITGSSGLLGRALVARFAGAGYQVLAHCRLRPGKETDNVQWLAGDFSTVESTADFLIEHKKRLKECRYLINNSGPITLRPTVDVTGNDLLADFLQQVVPAVDISRFLIAHAPLQSVLNIGFEYSGEIRAYQKILGYAMAKNALLLLTRSWAAVYPGICFNLFSPPSLENAEVLPKQAHIVAPELVAERIFHILRRRSSGFHYRYTDPPPAAKK